MKIASKKVDGNKVVFTWADGKAFEADVTKLSKEIVHRLALHGLSQKLGDSYASAESLAEAKENLSDVWDTLAEGKWTSTRSGGNIIVEALSRIMKISVEQAQENYDELDQEQKATIAKDQRVKYTVSVIKSERLQAKLANMKTDVEFTLPTKK